MKEASLYIKDKSGIAVACGLALPPAGKKTARANKLRAAAWAVVASWIDANEKLKVKNEKGEGGSLPPFPAKAPNGMWVRKDVEKWNGERIKNEKLKVKNGKGNGNAGDGSPSGGKLRQVAALQELPAQDAPADGELFPDGGGGFEKLLDQWQEKMQNPDNWLESPIQKWQLEQLRQKRPWLFGGGEAYRGDRSPDGESGDGSPHSRDDGGAEIYGGQQGVANWLNLNFQGRINTESGFVNAMAISRWLQMQNLPSGCKTGFPPPHGSGRFYKAQVRAWAERWIVRAGLAQSLPGPIAMVDAGEQLKAIQLKRELAEFEQWERSNSHRFMETEIVKSFMRGFGLWIGQQQDRLIEDRNGVRALVASVVGEVLNSKLKIQNEKTEGGGAGEVAVPLATGAEQCSALLAAIDARLVPLLQQANDGMKRAAAERGQGLLEQLTVDREEAIKQNENRG